jgi:PAS domain S-box-containing protein
MLDSLPAHVFVAMPPSGEIVWVNNRYLTYRGQTVQDLYQDPWVSLHPAEREEYLKAWGHAIRSGEQFSKQVRIRRFDGSYRWFYTRAVGHRDHRGVIVQWYGTHMDIHDQHLAEVKAARQEEIEASEAKHRQLANLIPQITFAATEDDGITFANEQWLSYTGQSFSDALGLGFMDHIHPEDLAKCHIPQQRPNLTPFTARAKKPPPANRMHSQTSSGATSSSKSSKTTTVSDAPTETTVKGIYQSLSRQNSSSSESVYEFPIAELADLAKAGVIKITIDSDGKQSYETEVRLRSKSGDYRWHLVRCVEVENIALGSGDGSWFGACTDIHDHKLLEKTLKENMDVKARFLSNMSHEIRTPLIGISGMVNFLQDTPLTDEQADYSNTIKSSADSLLNIINDILDLSKVDAGMMKLSYQWFHPRSLVEEVNEILCSLAITKRIELNYVVDPDVPDMVKGDKFRIRQVLLNIVGNAIKFTTVGEVFSRCRVVKDTSISGNEIMLEHSIIDTGSGFTQQEAEMIFKPFSQIDGSSTRTHGGTGLGLVISRQLVELHGGKMEGSAVPGQGSTFTFTAKFALPTEEDHPDLPPLTPSVSTPAISKDVSPIRSSFPSDPIMSRIPTYGARFPNIAGQILQSPPIDSPKTDRSMDSPTVMSSSGSEPSIRSLRSQATHRSSSSSTTQNLSQNLANFSRAARAGASDLSQMKLALPERPSSGSGITPTAPQTPMGSQSSQEGLSRTGSATSTDLKHVRPPMYSILIVCPQTHSREATAHHIEMILPQDVPHQITALASVKEAQSMISGDDPINFTHIVLNLGSKEEIVDLIDQIVASISLPTTSIVVLSDPVQRQEIVKMTTEYDYEQLVRDRRVTFVFKPVKPSRFAVIFDPEREREFSTDRNRSTAQQQVADQKQSYLDVTKRLGNRGLNVLLVEDNPVNQKVLLKYLNKINIAVELALDGVECTKKVFSHDHSYYSLILVSFPSQFRLLPY